MTSRPETSLRGGRRRDPGDRDPGAGRRGNRDLKCRTALAEAEAATGGGERGGGAAAVALSIPALGVVTTVGTVRQGGDRPNGSTVAITVTNFHAGVTASIAAVARPRRRLRAPPGRRSHGGFGGHDRDLRSGRGGNGAEFRGDGRRHRHDGADHRRGRADEAQAAATLAGNAFSIPRWPWSVRSVRPTPSRSGRAAAPSR